MSFEVIAPFLRPIEQLLADDTVTEIMVNPGGAVFVERDGLIETAPGVRFEEKPLRVAVTIIARSVDDDVTEEKPILDARLPDGSRVAAMIPPCSVGGTTLTIRKFSQRWFTVDELLRVGTLSTDVVDTLRQAIETGRNILISGGTGTGKTTLLNALASFIPGCERVILIEDTSEVKLKQPNVVAFEARREQQGLPTVSIRELLRASLRHRPDRIILGEVRGAEAFDLLQALNTGHGGSLTTTHANSAARALSRLTNCVMEADQGLPHPVVCARVAESIDLVAHIDRLGGRRQVTELIEVSRYDHGSDSFELKLLGGDFAFS